MNFSDYEALASRTRNRSLDQRDALLDAASGLAEESGEVLAIVRKHAFQGRALSREQLKVELGDALWCLAMTARHAGLTLDEIASANHAKLSDRFPAGYTDAAAMENRS